MYVVGWFLELLRLQRKFRMSEELFDKSFITSKRSHQYRSPILSAMAFKVPWILLLGVPMTTAQMALRAVRQFWKLPKMLILESARTIRVLVAWRGRRGSF